MGHTLVPKLLAKIYDDVIDRFGYKKLSPTMNEKGGALSLASLFINRPN